MNEHFGTRILTTDYSRVFICDLQRPKEEPERLDTQYQYNELKAVPVSSFMLQQTRFEFRHTA